MKKLLKVAAAATLLVSFAPSISAQELANTKVVTTANVQPLSVAETQQILREVAVSKGIPAEILKAMAFVETGMKQFNSDGTPIEATDGGIGIMQLTLTPSEISQFNVDVEKLKYDTKYNIEQGANHLLRKWKNKNLPQVNNHEQNKIEDWYFAVMAYNGLSKRNDPNFSGSNAYQEKVFNSIRDNSQIPLGNTPKLSIAYPNPSAPELMEFPGGVDYQWPTRTNTTQNYMAKEIGYTYNTFGVPSKLRKSITDTTSTGYLNYTPVQIEGGPYDSPSIYNHFAFYKVKGTNFDGYMASSNLQTSKDVKLFTDISGEVQRSVTFLQTRKTINGYADGFRAGVQIPRKQAAALIVQALDLKLPSGYKMKATDVSASDPLYQYMMIAEAHGIMGAGGTFKPNDLLIRSDMATILVRAYSEVFENPPASYKFAGVDTTDPNYANINKLAYNGITVNNPFNRNGYLTRGEYARFLERSVIKQEAKQH